MASIEKGADFSRADQSTEPANWPGAMPPASWFFRQPEESGMERMSRPPSSFGNSAGSEPETPRPPRVTRSHPIGWIRSRRPFALLALGLLLSGGTAFTVTTRLGAAGAGNAAAAGGQVFNPPRADAANTAAVALSQVMASGSTVVAVGSRAAATPAFLVSADGGRTFREAGLRSAVSTAGHSASLVTGGPGGWVAFGPRAIWDSPDGRTWTLVSVHGPATAGDTITGLASTSSGFVMTGTNAKAGTGVVWTSANGVVWHRFTAAQFGLVKEPGEQVFAMTSAAASGSTTMIVGTARSEGQVCSYAWISRDGGASWRTVVVPMGHGAGGMIAGLAGIDGHYIAVRPGTAADGHREAVVYSSADAVNWSFATAISAPAGFSPAGVEAGSGTTGEFVVDGRDSAGNTVAYTSQDRGGTWTRGDGFGLVPTA